MSEALLGVVIGGAFGFLGALLGVAANAWLENQKARRQRLHEVRLRLVGTRIQTSEVKEFIRLQRRRKWPQFWQLGQPDLSQTNLRETDLRRQNLKGATLFRADLTGVDLDYADLRQADLSKAILNTADLANAKLAKANLHRADLSGANLAGANLEGACLIGANMKGAYLIGANLKGVDLTGADISGANLKGADLREATITGCNVINVRHDDSTRWPQGVALAPHPMDAKRLPAGDSTSGYPPTAAVP